MAEKEKFPIDLRDFRAKTIARIIDKKREDQLREVKDYESKRAEANAFRTKWKEQVKDKRNKEVVEAVDDDLIRAAIPDIDNNNSNTAFLEKKLQNEQNLMELISDLHPVEDLENFDRKRDSGVFTVSMPDAYSSSSKAAFEFNTGGIIPSSIKFLQKVGAFELQVRDKLNDVVEEENGSAAHISNKLQISSLMNDLLNIHSMKNEDMLKFQRPPSGLMLQAIQEAQNSSWLKPFRVERSSSFVSHPYVNGVLRSKSIDPADDPNNSPASPAKQKPKNDRASIMSYVESLKSGSNPSESFSPRSLGIGGSESVIPSVLYQSDNDYPPEMMTMLPAYCFPSGAEIVISPIGGKRNVVNMPAKLETAKTTTAIGVDSTKRKKKLKVFFPSDFSIRDSVQNEKLKAADKFISNKLPLNSSNNSNMATQSQQPFILLLGDHTYQQYCLVQPYPMTFTDVEWNITIQTTYVLCLLTKFPFFSYFTFIWNQIEEEMHLLDLDKPLDAVNLMPSTNSHIRNLNEVVTKLQKTLVPLYPYLISNRAKAGENLDESTLSSAISEQQYVSIIPDIPLKLNLQQCERKFVEYKRSLFQIFYSSHARNFEEITDGLLSNVKFHEKLKSEQFQPTLSHKLEKDKEESFLLLQWALPTILKYLPLDQIILLLGCAMTEMRIIVKHRDLHIVSGIILAIIHLLKPLKWCSPVIASLPEELKDFVESPVPIILGMQKLPSDFVLVEGCVVVDPQERRVHFHPTDVVHSSSTLLPNASRLVSALRSPAEKIFTLSRKRRIKAKVAVHSDKVTTSPTKDVLPLSNPASPELKAERKITLNSPIKDIDKLNPLLPLDLDITSEDSINFSGAIKQFSTVVSNHILAIINTAIQFQQKEKEDARAKRRVLTNRTKNANANAKLARAKEILMENSPSQRENMIPFNNTKVNGDAQRSTDKSSPDKILHPDRDESSDEAKGVSNSPDAAAGPKLPHIIDIKNLATRSNDSVHDDTYSELTFTDTAVENETNNSGDSVAPSGMSVASSSASSLPSLKSDAPMLALKEIGQMGMKFVNKMIDTQMYSNYCQNMKLDTGVNVVDGSFLEKAATDGEVNLPNQEDKEVEFDSIISLFEILESGTVPLDEDVCEELKIIYRKLYGNEDTISPFILESIPEMTKEVKKLGQSRRRLKRSLEKVLDGIADGINLKVSTIAPGDIQYCNGLLCNGFCNTEYCNDICIKLWERKVHHLRHKQAAFEIITKRYEKQPELTFSSTMETSESYKVEYISKGGVRLQQIKHGRETPSQYEKRREVVGKSIAQSRATAEGKQAIFKRDKKKSAAQKRIIVLSLYSPKENTNTLGKKIRKREFIGNDEQHSAYTYSLAKYYAKREEKLAKRYFKSRMAILRRFLLRYIFYFRKVKFLRGIYLLQAVVRGFLVRSAIPALVENLIDRKTSRLLSTIRIRNFLRGHDAFIYRNWKRKQDIRFRKRQSSVSIPVHMPGDSPKLTKEALLYHTAEDRKGEKSPLRGPSIKKYINEPSLPPADTKPVAKESPEKKLEPAPQIPSDRPGANLRSSFSAVDEVAIGFMEQNAKKQQQSFSNKAMEFMQFGMVFNRKPSPRNSTTGMSNPASRIMRRASTPATMDISTIKQDAEKPPLIPVSLNNNINDVKNGSNNFVKPDLRVHITDGMNNAVGLHPNVDLASKASTPYSVAQQDGVAMLSLSPLTVDTPISLETGDLNLVAPSTHENEIEVDLPRAITTSQVAENQKDGGSTDDDELHRKSIEKEKTNNSVSKDFILHGMFETIVEPQDGELRRNPSDSSFPIPQKEISSKTSDAPERRLSMVSDLSGGGIDSDLMSVGTADRSHGYVSKALQMHIISTDKLASSSASVMSNTTSKELDEKAKKKSTPLGRYTAANNYALGSMVPNNYGSGSISPRGSATGKYRSTRRESKMSLPDDQLYLDGELRQDSGLNHEEPVQDIISENEPIVVPKSPPIINQSSAKLSNQTVSPKNISPKTLAYKELPIDTIVEEGADDAVKEDDDDSIEKVSYSSDGDSQGDDIFEELGKYPLKTLGPLAGNFLNRQQLSLVKTMWLALREGINVIKHGRKGKPSHKTLFCDYYMTKLYWRNPGSKLDKDDLDASMDHDLHAVNSAYTNTTGTSDPDSLQDSGSLFKSKNSSLDVKRRSSFFGSTNRRSSLTKADSERVLFLKDIVNITHDCTSEVLQRASAKNYLGTNGYNILSIIAIGRSLDMEIEQDIWETIFYALQILVAFFRQVHENSEGDLLNPALERLESTHQLHYIRKNEEPEPVSTSAKRSNVPKPSSLGVSTSLEELDREQYREGIALPLEYDRVGQVKHQKPHIPTLKIPQTTAN